MLTYRITELHAIDRPRLGLLDVEGAERSFSDVDSEEIARRFFGYSPPPKILIELHWYQDWNLRQHGAAHYVNGNGTQFWIFPYPE